MSLRKCASCGHQNDETRVYCHNCGDRLEGVASQNAPKVTPAPIKQAKKRRGPGCLTMIGAFVRSILSIAVMAFILAVVIQCLRTPDNVPSPVVGDAEKAAMLTEQLKLYVVSPYQRTLDLTDAQVDGYLAARLMPTTDAGMPQASFKRAFVQINQGSFKITLEKSIFGMPVFVSATYALQSSAAGTTAAAQVAQIGRMKMPPIAAGIVASRVFDPLAVALNEVVSLLGQANHVALQPGVARLQWPVKKNP